MPSVFVSYRRGDSEGQARALTLELVKVIGRESVYMDVDSTALGLDFRRVVYDRLASCDLMLVLIGPHWLEATDTAGHRRLDDPADLVRHEIAAALRRNVPVIPVLLQGTPMPPADRLPDDVKELAYRQGFDLGHATWESDVSEIITRLGLSGAREGAVRAPLEKVDPHAGAERSVLAQDKTRWALATVMALVVLVAAVALYPTARDGIPGGGTTELIGEPLPASPAGSEPSERLAGFGTITIANLKARHVEVYGQSSAADSKYSAGYAGDITSASTTLQVPAGIYKLKVEQLFFEHVQVEPARSADILFGAISVPGLARDVEVYAEKSAGDSKYSAGYAGTITPPETMLQVPAGSYKLKIGNLFLPSVRVEANQTVTAQ